MQDFRDLFKRNRHLTTIVGAYDAVSAALVERAGYDAIWISSYCVSLSQFALPDLNLVSASEIMETARRMRAASGLPLMLDAGNGYGSDLILQRLVSECIAGDIQAICIDDNEYPEACSLYEAPQRRLISISGMQARIESARRAARQGKGIYVVARTEALIAGMEEKEAAQRATAYAESGADAVLVHSRSFESLARVVDSLNIAVPLIAIPTLYPDVTIQQLLDHKIAAAIYANQVLRASIKAIDAVLVRMKHSITLQEVEEQIMPLTEIEKIIRLDAYCL